MMRRKELYEEKHPETKHGGDRVSTKRKQFPLGEQPKGFAASTAAAIGKVERLVRLDVQRGRMRWMGISAASSLASDSPISDKPLTT